MVFLVILVWMISVILNAVNLRYSQKAVLPATLKDALDERTFQKSKSYLKDRTVLSILRSTVLGICQIIVLLWLLPLLDQALDLSNLSAWINAFICWTIIQYIFTLANLPVEIYRTIYLDKKYELSNITWNRFWSDFLKSLLLRTLLTLLASFLYLLIVKILWLQNWWILLATIVSVIVIFIEWIYPMLILPLFNKFTPVEGSLKERITEFVKKAGFKVKNVYTVNASIRTKAANAYLAGIGSSKRVVLYDTIMNYPEEEISAVLAHELGHYRYKHIPKMLAASIAMVWILSYIFYLALSTSFLEKILHLRNIFSLLAAFVIILNLLGFFVMPLLNWISRRFEYQSDEYSASLMNSPEPLINSLKRLLKQNLSNPVPSPVFAIWYYTHPTPADRIRHLENLSKKRAAHN